MAATVATPAVAVNYTAAVVAPFRVSTVPVSVNYTFQPAAGYVTSSPSVAVNYTLPAGGAGLYKYLNGQVVRPGLYRWSGGVITNMATAAPAAPSYPQTFGAVGTYWPGPTTTGVPAGTTLTVVNGDLTTTADNQVIDKIDLRGNLIVKHANVTFQRGIIRGQATIPTTQATNIVLVNCFDVNVRNFLIRDSEVFCQTPNEWSVGIDGHDWTRERCNFHDLQDGARYRNRSATEPSFCVSRQNWTHDFTWFTSAVSRQPSGQTHNDANQLAGAQGVLIEGDNMDGYYGPNGLRQPTLYTNTSTAWANDTPSVASNTTAPELAAVMINVESGTGRQVTGLIVRQCRVAGFVTTFNMGDPGMANANVGTIVQNIITSDGPHAVNYNPPRTVAQVVGQVVDWGVGDPARCNRWATTTGTHIAGQEIPVLGDAASTPEPPTAAFTGTPLTGAGSVTVQFTSTSSGAPTAYSWSFGDGTSSTAQNPSHTYAPGTYTVSLTASNAGGANVLTRTGYVTVSAGAAPAQSAAISTAAPPFATGTTAFPIDSNRTTL